MAKNIYRGFSTLNRRNNFRVSDYDLVRQDLFNHFNIRKGEKLMNPNFGTIIWNMLFDPLTSETKKIMIDDVRRIVNYDPRIAVQNVILNEFDRGLQIEIELTYLTTNQTDTLSMNFDRDSMKLTRSSQ
jgi:phage baseplate assembly protein W